MALLPVIQFVLSLVFAASLAHSAASSLGSSVLNTTSMSPGTITSLPSPTISSSASINTSCSSCVFAIDARGLQQIFWFSETWSVTLDTEHVTVTSYNGSNATATTNTRTVTGNIKTLNTSVDYIYTLMKKLDNPVMYFNSEPTLVRGTDGNVGTTSFPYGQAYAEVTAVNYRYMVPNSYCPANMGKGPSGPCICMFDHWYPAGLPVKGISTSEYILDQTYYTPLPASVINEDNAGGADDIDSLEPWDGENIRAWLAENAAFKSAFPNWEDCVFWNTAAGPPAVKLPVAALTSTVSTTVHEAAPTSKPTPAPAFQSTPPLPKATTHMVSSPSLSPSPATSSSSPLTEPSAGVQSQSGGGSESDSSENEGSEAGDSESQSNGGSEGNTGEAEDSGSGNSESQSNSGSEVTSGETEDSVSENSESQNDSGTEGNSGESEDDEPGDSSPQGSNDSSNNSIDSSENNNSDTQEGDEPENPSSSTLTDSAQENNSPDPDTPLAPFTITAGTHTISGTIHGTTAAIIAGTTVIAGGSPFSVDGALISIPPDASRIIVNGDSQALPTLGAALTKVTIPIPIATIGSQTISALPSAAEVYYAGSTLSRNGAHVMIDDVNVYLGSSGLVIGGSTTVAIPTAPRPESISGDTVIFTAAGHIFTSLPSGVAIAGTSIPLGSAAVISGTTILYGASGLLIGSSTIPIPTPSTADISASPSLGSNANDPTHIITLASQTLAANPNAIFVGDKTLIPGAPAITISGTPISLGYSGIVIASSTYEFPAGALPSRTTVIGAETFTIDATAVEVDGQTLHEGGSAVTVHGTMVSVGGEGLVVTGSTVALTAASTTSGGLGGIIMGGFGPSETASSGSGTGNATGTPSVVGFRGAAVKVRAWESTVMLGLVIINGLVAWGNVY